jgi:mannose-1-phosphate guanylyltransferase
MKAVILVGGFGTRLRPLTLNTPKPLIPLVNRPFFDHTLYMLRLHKVREVVLAVGYRSETFQRTYGDGSGQGMKLEYVYEDEPLDTGGAIKNVEAHLTPGESFLVFNGDVLTDLDLTDMLRYHREKGSVCTISLTPVEDPSQYGVVDMDSAGKIERFTEKPKREEATSNWINAGTYIMETEVLAGIPAGQRWSVERAVFPGLLKGGSPLYGYKSNAYWMDIGTPDKYMQAHADILEDRIRTHIQPYGEMIGGGIWAGEGTFVHHSAHISGHVVLGKNCHIAEGANIMGPTVLDDGCYVAEGATVDQVVAWKGVKFAPNSRSRRCVVANNAQIGQDSVVEDAAIVGDGASTGAGNHLARGIKIWPGVVLPDKSINI